MIAIEDLPTRAHVADIVVDATPGRRGADYAALLESRTVLLAGSAYALLRPVWRRLSAGFADRGVAAEVDRIAVSMGGTDPVDATSRVLRAIAATALDCAIDVILGPTAPHRARVAASLPARARLHVDPPDLPALVGAADLVIGACGSSFFERAMLGRPSLLIQLADNQRDIARAVAAAGAATVVPASLLDAPDALAEEIRLLARSHDRRAAQASAARSLCDGRGAQRVAMALAGEVDTARHGVASLRVGEWADSSWLLDLQRQPGTRSHARNPAVPSAEEHEAWLASTLKHPDRLLAVVTAGGERVAMLRLDRQQGQRAQFEISIAVDAERRGQGLGTAALALARLAFPAAEFRAWIHPANLASQRLFAAAGYRRIDDSEWMSAEV